MAEPAGQADLARIRAGVRHVLDDFLERQRRSLAAVGEELMPVFDVVAGLLAGGKRLRPAFCYWGWRAAGGPDWPEILAAATALELLQASALVHDDVMDGSDTRRGLPTVHRDFARRHAEAGWRGGADAFGLGAAILAGDLLLAWTDELFHDSGLPAVAQRRGQPVLDAMRTEVLAGQYLDLIGQAAGDGTVASALRVAAYKSAKYTVERPLQLGAALAGAPPGTRLTDGLSRYAMPVGVAFQLRDDILGAFGDPSQTGKPVSDDIRAGKRTVLAALARERATPAQAAVLDRGLGNQRLDDHGMADVLSVLVETGALTECERMIERGVADALSALDALVPPDEAALPGQARAALAELALAATARTG
jgi:geranylgeranyl diphosphate synthase type I